MNNQLVFQQNLPLIQVRVAEFEEKLQYEIGIPVKAVVHPVQSAVVDQFAEITEKAAAIWGIEPQRISARSRKFPLVTMRQILLLLFEQYEPKLPLRVHAETLGLTDHTSVLHNRAAAIDHIDTHDELFMRYYKPVQHLFLYHPLVKKDANTKAI